MDIRMSNIALPMCHRSELSSQISSASHCPAAKFIPMSHSDIPKTTWLDIDKTVENTNPILLDATEVDIFIDGLYRGSC